MDDRKTMDIDEFVTRGHLREVNRSFFEPLGLELTFWVRRDDDGALVPGAPALVEILDHRDGRGCAP